MDLSIDPIQRRLADAVDTALTRTGDPSTELAGIGVPELSVAETLGGLGLGLAADIMVSSRLGYGLEPLSAYRETVLALDLLAEAGIPGPHLGDVFKGTRHAVTVGLHSGTGLRVDSGGLLWGESECLPPGDIGLAVVRAVEYDGPTGWYLVLPQSPSCRTEPVERLGVSRLRLHFAGASVRPLAVTDERCARALDAARVRQAAMLLGLADRALDTARSHVNNRVQYGKPLVELQTVAHSLARLSGDADGWRLLLHETAWHCDRGGLHAAKTARLLAVASEHAMLAARRALQLHGVRGMLAHSTAATVYRIASVEGVRMGTPARIWRLAAGV